ncbi:DHA2 family efflux MFS transporter permease subunit [Tomitella fengzijianii]|uniref:DHA2 family efflux MFS transporter permease subunit n=1 Tax=Tomitella fengzijianii TaxID=2597660 RepID=A0A516X2K2_9ACTN|nr:DHA2 family efflux MFS transporter permease subunit [Tomitella fengzijianii]QDQ97257.1 DHA2 family efflux MFS transporter permease subunit [Tomitella fengzijianii]
MNDSVRPWPALWALCLGFFMILVDSTIVSVAMPAIMEGLDADLNAVMWVTSAYLVAFAVPLLITGRLGDRFGQRQMYLAGLVVFTASSAWCGFSGGVTMLIVARVFQGIGAAIMTPQTMAVITRVFPPDRRGRAMGAWGAVAGAATLVGPLLGGVLTDSLGWEWIFFVNIPVGVIGFALAWALVPDLPRRSHTFDIPGVVLSGAGVFLLVFGIQEGQKYRWGTMTGFLSIPLLIGLGVVLLAVFVWWQSRTRAEPLVPLRLFRDRNFTLANIAIASMGFAITALVLPLMLFTQLVLGYSPTESALVMTPMAVLTGVLAPSVGRLVDRVHPRYIAGPGLLLLAVSVLWFSLIMEPGVPVWELLLPVALMGVANATIWSPLSATATRNLAMDVAGAGSGVYNTTRQVGAVLGSAAITAAMSARLVAGGLSGAGGGEQAAAGGTQRLPEFMRDAYALAMGQSMLVPAAVLLIGVVAALCFERPSHAGMRPLADRTTEPGRILSPERG